MRILADLHISPRTVEFLRGLGYEAARVSQALDPRASDAEIAAHARREGYVILSQDLDFSKIVALSGHAAPSCVILRLSSSRIERVNATLAAILPSIAADLEAGALITVEDSRVRTRRLPVQ